MPPKKQPRPLKPKNGILARTFAELAPRCAATLGPNWKRTRPPSSSSTSARPPPADPSPTEPNSPAGPSDPSSPPDPTIPVDSAGLIRPSLPTSVSTNLTPTLGKLVLSSSSSDPNDPTNTPILVNTTDSSSTSQTIPGLKRSSSDPTLSSSAALTATDGALTELLQPPFNASNLISPSSSGITVTAGSTSPDYGLDSDPDGPASPSFVPSGKYIPRSKRPSLRPPQLPSPAHPHPERTPLPTNKPNCPFTGTSPPPFPSASKTATLTKPPIPPRPDLPLGLRSDEDGAKTPTQENPYPFPRNLKETSENTSVFGEDDYIEDDGEWRSDDGSLDSVSGMGEFAGGFYVGDDGTSSAIGDNRLEEIGGALGGDGYKDVEMGGVGGVGTALEGAKASASMLIDSSDMALGGWTWEKHKREWEIKDREDAELAKAIENSKHEVGGVGNFGGVEESGWVGGVEDAELARAIENSKREVGVEDMEMGGMSEEEQLAMAIKLSKQEMWGTDEDVDMDATPTQENPNPFGGFGNGGRGRFRTMDRAPRSLLFDDNAGGLDASQMPSRQGMKGSRDQEHENFVAEGGKTTPRQAAGSPRMKPSSSGGSAMARQRKRPSGLKVSFAGGEAMSREPPGPSAMTVGSLPIPSPQSPPPYQSPYPPQTSKPDKGKGKAPIKPRPGLTRQPNLSPAKPTPSAPTEPSLKTYGINNILPPDQIDLSTLDRDEVQAWIALELALRLGFKRDEAREAVKKWKADGWTLKWAGEWDLKAVWGHGIIADTIWKAKSQTKMEGSEEDVKRLRLRGGG